MKTVQSATQVKAADRKTNTLSLLLLALCAFMVPDLALAAGSNPIENGLNALIGFLNSGVVRSLGILAIFALGGAAYIGRLSWEMAIRIIIGVVFTFGAAGIVDMISSWV